MPLVSVIIPTHNRPEFLKKALLSVLGQTYHDLEIIVVDDGLTERADKIISELNDQRIKYIQHDTEKGGSAARNTGVKAATGKFIAFLDDDDRWLPQKLALQIVALETTTEDVGFCFSGAINDLGAKFFKTTVPAGIGNYHERALAYFKGFLTVTLIFKNKVFEETGLFDESLPSHQEAELMIRVTKKYLGLGINQALVRINFNPTHASIGRNINNRIKGMEMVLEKYTVEYKMRPKVLAAHLFNLANFYRQNKDQKNARLNLIRAFGVNPNARYLLHYFKSLII